MKRSVSKFMSLSDSYRKIAPYLNVGYVWAASVILFTFIGIKLDDLWETKPWFTLIGVLFGVGGGFYHFLKTVLKANKQENRLKF
jgi:F0F1-type ATP synthase assembly protein I